MAINRDGAGRTPTDEATSLRLALVRIHRQLRVLADSGLTASQASALSRIEQFGPVRIGTLAEAERTAPASMSRIVEFLSVRKLVDRLPDPRDGRASLVQLSPDGKEFLWRLRGLGTDSLQHAIDELDPSQRKTIRDAVPLLEALSDKLNRER